MTDVGFLQHKLHEIAETSRAKLCLRLDHEENRAAQPSIGGTSIVEPAAELVLDELNAALRDMARCYLRLCDDERQPPKRHLGQFQTEAAAAAAAFVQLWYTPALRLVRRRPYAEPDVNTLFDEMQARAAEIARGVTKDVARGYVGQGRVDPPPFAASKAKTGFWPPVVEKAAVDLLAKIIVGVLIGAGGAAIVYFRLF